MKVVVDGRVFLARIEGVNLGGLWQRASGGNMNHKRKFYCVHFMSGRSLFRAHRPRTLAVYMTTCLLVATAVGPCATHAVAAVRAWRGTSDAVWTNANNWDTSPAPGTGDTAIFNAAAGVGGATISLGAGVTISTILFDTANAAAYTLGSGAVGSQTLTLNSSGGVTVNNGVTNNQLLNAAITLGTDGTVQSYFLTNNSPTAGLTFAGNITGSTGSGLKSLYVGGLGNTTIGGVIANGTTGTVGLWKTDPGTLTLTANNTFNGNTGNIQGTMTPVSTQVLNGNLTLSGNGKLSSTIGVQINGHGSLKLDNTGNDINNRLTGQAVGLMGRLTLLGSSSADSSETVGSLNQFTRAGTIAITPGSGRKATLTATQTGFSANLFFLNVLAGSGTLGGGASTDPYFKFTGAPVTVNNVMPGTIANSTDFAKYDVTNGVQPLAAGDYSGSFGAANNVLVSSNTSTGGAASANTLKITGGTLTLGGALTIGSATSSGYILKSGPGSATITGNSLTPASGQLLAFAGDGVLTIASTATVNMQIGGSGTGVVEYTGLPANRTLIPNGNGILRISTANANSLTGINIRGGIVELTGGGTYTGTHTFDPTTFSGGGYAAFGTDATVSRSGGTQNWVQTGGLFIGDYVPFLLNSPTATAKITFGNPVNMGSSTLVTHREIRVVDNPASATDMAEISGVISGGSTYGLLKTGAGTLILSNAGNSYTGRTTINAGTLQLGNGTTTGSLNPASAITNNSILAFNRSNTLTQGTDFNSVISGTGGVSQLGTGTTTLSGINTYTGPTTVSAGILNIQHASALGTTDAGTSVTSGATLQVQGISIGAESLTLSGAGAAGQNGSLVNVSGTNNYGGLVTLDSATTISSDSGVLNLTNTGTITGATRALTLTGAGNGRVSSIIGTTTGSVTKSGAGKWELAGNNSYSGGTTISAGTLVAAAVGSLGTGTTTIGGGTLEQGIANALSGSSLSLNAGTFNLNGYSTAVSSLSGSAGTVSNSSANTLAILTANASGDSTFSGVIQDGVSSDRRVGLTKSGVGSLTLAGVNSYTGPTTVAGGTLVVNGSIQTDVSIASGAFLSGSGTIGYTGGSTSTVGRLSGAGTISPDSITGAAAILSAYTFNPTAGLGAAFEFTSATSAGVTPAFNSLNDVLNLTTPSLTENPNAADPFAGTGGLTGLTSANKIDIYFNVTSILPADRFSGGMFVNFGAGIYTDTATLIAGVQNATYTYWVRSTGSGVRTFNGVNYDSFTSNVTLGAIDASLDGVGSGYLTEFVVVPEPDTIALAGLGIAMAAWTIWKRRRISQLETGTGTVSAKRGG